MTNMLPDGFPKGLPRPNIAGRSDHQLSGRSLPSDIKWRRAAVLVPIVQRAQPSLLLTKRSTKLKKHAGQIAFPGGKVDPDDATTAAAALRELQEEVNISSDKVQMVGELDTYKTVTGFEITPHVGLLQPDIKPAADLGEVAEIFEVPLNFVLNRKNHKRETAIYKGEERHYFAIPYEKYYIWGATAHMLVNLTDTLENMGALNSTETR